MKKIINVGFAPANEEETPQVNYVAAKVQPSGSGSGSGSGDGSGSGSGSVNFGSGLGSIQSSIGGSWNANCSFNWSAALTSKYDANTNSRIVTKAVVAIDNITLSCYGVSAGGSNSGVRYAPFDYSNIIIGSNNIEATDGMTAESPFGLLNVDCSITTKKMEFKVMVETYVNNKKSTAVKAEDVQIQLNFSFFINGSVPEISLESCQIS